MAKKKKYKKQSVLYGTDVKEFVEYLWYNKYTVPTDFPRREYCKLSGKPKARL